MINKTNILLCNGRYANYDFLNLIRDIVKDRLPQLSHNGKYTAKMICSEGFWDLLGRGEQITAGLCMSHLVAAGELPLKVAKSRHEYPVNYQLK